MGTNRTLPQKTCKTCGNAIKRHKGYCTVCFDSKPKNPLIVALWWIGTFAIFCPLGCFGACSLTFGGFPRNPDAVFALIEVLAATGIYFYFMVKYLKR